MVNAFPFDVRLQLKDAGAVTSTAVATVGGSAATARLDIGGPDEGVGTALLETTLVLHVSACDAGDGNETYNVEYQVSNVADFSSGVFTVVSIPITRGTVGTHRIPVANEIFGVRYRYARLNTVVGGTTPSINYVAYLAQLGRAF